MRAKDRDIKKVFQAVLFLPLHSSVHPYKTTRAPTRQPQKGEIPLLLGKYKVLIQNQRSMAPSKEKSLSYRVLSPSSTSLTADHTELSLMLRKQ